MLPETIAAGLYEVEINNGLGSAWARLPEPFLVEEAGDDAQAEVVKIQVKDFFPRFGIPDGGLNFTTGTPVNGTAAIAAALEEAAKQEGSKE